MDDREVQERLATARDLNKKAREYSRLGLHGAAFRAQNKEYAIREAIATEYGRRHGWLIYSPFSVPALETGRRRRFPREIDELRFPGWAADHPVFYRDATTRAAMAVVAFNYDGLASALKFTSALNISVRREEAFPGWYSVGEPSITIIVFQAVKA